MSTSAYSDEVKAFFLKVTGKRPFKYQADQEWQAYLNGNASQVFQQFIQDGLIEPLSEPENLEEKYSKPALMELAKSLGLPQYKNRPELIESIRAVQPEWEADALIEFYRLTDAGAEFSKLAKLERVHISDEYELDGVFFFENAPYVTLYAIGKLLKLENPEESVQEIIKRIPHVEAWTRTDDFIGYPPLAVLVIVCEAGASLDIRVAISSWIRQTTEKAMTKRAVAGFYAGRNRSC